MGNYKAVIYLLHTASNQPPFPEKGHHNDLLSTNIMILVSFIDDNAGNIENIDGDEFLATVTREELSLKDLS